MDIAQKRAIREERKKFGEMLLVDLKDEFARADILCEKLKPIVLAHPEGIASVYHRVAHPFVGAYAISKLSLEYGMIAQVVNSYEGCIFRIEGFEDQIEEELRPSGLLREMVTKIKDFERRNPDFAIFDSPL